MQPSLDALTRRCQVLLSVVITPAIAMATAELKGSKAPARGELGGMNHKHRWQHISSLKAGALLLCPIRKGFTKGRSTPCSTSRYLLLL